MKMLALFIFSIILPACANLDARAPASGTETGAIANMNIGAQNLGCPMVQPLSENETATKTEDSLTILNALKSKGYKIVNHDESTPTQNSYLTSLREGESGIITTIGSPIDPTYVRLVMLKKISGQVQVLKILTSSTSKTIDELFLQLPPCS